MTDINERITNLSPQKRALLEARLRQRRTSLEGTGKPVIPRREITGPGPLSLAQQRMWFLAQLEPDSPLYNVARAIRLAGPLDAAALQQALAAIVARHEVLRTTFADRDGHPVQIVGQNWTVELPAIDLSSWPEPDRTAELHRLLRQEAQRPFNLSEDLLLRAVLLRLAAQEHILWLGLHHIACDGWSLELLFHELALFYQAFTTGKTPALPELPIQYADFALWQRQRPEETLEKDRAYWQEQFTSLPLPLNLPLDRPRPPVQSSHGAYQSMTLPPALLNSLKVVSRQEEATLFMILLAAFKVLLYRYTGQADLVVGSPLAGRTHTRLEPLIGFFVHTLALRTDLSGRPTFREFLKRVRQVALGAYAHQKFPFEKLVEELRLDRDLSRPPLFQIMFQLKNLPRWTVELPELVMEWFPFDSGIAPFDLSLETREQEEGLVCSATYNIDLFEGGTIERMLGYYRTLLAEIVANPDRSISELPLLTAAEEQQLLVEWNRTGADYPREQGIHRLFEAQVERTPEAIAVVDGQEQVTYRELNSRANQLAHYLRKQGVGPEVLVGICVERSPEMVVGLLAILKAGGAYLPLDPAYPAERLGFMLKDSQSPLLLTRQRFLDRFSEYGENLICLDRDWEVIGRERTDNPFDRSAGEHLVYVIYTSGSTGQPKGVQIEQAGLNNLVFWHRRTFNIVPEDRATQIAGLSFDALGWELWPYLTAGATIYLPDEETRLSPAKLWQWLSREGITCCYLPTPLAEALLQVPVPADLSLRYLLTGGDQLHPLKNRNWSFGLVNSYGPTESTITNTWAFVEVETDPGVSPPIGRPIANTQIYLLDTRLQSVPIGVPGELYIGGKGLARGYLNRPELTAARFIPHPFSQEAGARLYRTGDMARYRADGQLEFLGRVDTQVKIRGVRVELGEIEAVLSQHPQVQAAAVVAAEDGADSKRLLAYVISNREASSMDDELRHFSKQRLPEPMIPIAFIPVDHLPLTPNGKVDRQALAALNLPTSLPAEKFVAPRTAIEEILAEIWTELLPVEQVGIHDDFFALGGHSLLATQVTSRLRTLFRIDLPVRSLFENPTVAELAGRVVSKEAGPDQIQKVIRAWQKIKLGQRRE